MNLQGWLQEWLGIADLYKRVAELDNRMVSIEGDVDSALQHFGKYHSHTVKELEGLRAKLETTLEVVSNVIETLENQADKQRAARLKRRLKYNVTKITNALARRIA